MPEFNPGPSEIDLPLDGRIGGFVILQRPDGRWWELGRGAFGITYKAEDESLQRPVALKMIRPELHLSQTARERFVREARAAATLRHPNAATVYQLQLPPDGPWCYAMEFVAGETLENVLEEGRPLSVLDRFRIAELVAGALSAAHELGMIHRDIKPGNIMIQAAGPGLEVKVIDFGLARILEDAAEEDSTVANLFFGTPSYASPEQCAGESVNAQSDLYSLGAVMWRMFVGEPLFGGSPAQVMNAHLTRPVSLEKANRLPHPVRKLVLQMLAKKASERPASAQEVRLQLAALQPVSPVQRWRQRRRRFAFSAALLSILATLGLAGWLVLAYLQEREAQNALAVLPFETFSNNKDDHYIGDGLASEINARLSTIGDLRVISRRAVQPLVSESGKARVDLGRIRETLHCSRVLEGTVQRAGSHFRIVTTLVDTENGRSIWAKAYDQTDDDLLSLQGLVATAIANALQARLSGSQREELRAQETSDASAYQLYLRGLALYQILHREENEQAIELLRSALEKDPKFAEAYAALADAYVTRVRRFGGDQRWIEEAFECAKKAVEIMPNRARGHSALARVWNWKNAPEKAIEEAKRAVAIAPNDEESILAVADSLLGTDQFYETYVQLKRYHEVNPVNVWAPYCLAMLCNAIDDSKLADSWMEKAESLEKDSTRKLILKAERQMLGQDYRGALKTFKQVPQDIQSYGSSVRVLSQCCRMKLGEWADLRQSAEEIIKKDPENLTDRIYLILAQHSKDDATKAQADAQGVAQLIEDRREKQSLDNYGKLLSAVVFHLLGKDDEARLWFKSAYPAVLVSIPLGSRHPFFNFFTKDPFYTELFIQDAASNRLVRDRIRKL